MMGAKEVPMASTSLPLGVACRRLLHLIVVVATPFILVFGLPR
jgi:hypothetical protein